MAWTIRFRGKDERDTLAKADLFFLENKEAIGLAREEFFARLVSNEEGTEMAFVATAEPLWNLRPVGVVPVGTEPGLGAEPPASGPGSAAEEDAW